MVVITPEGITPEVGRDRAAATGTECGLKGSRTRSLCAVPLMFRAGDRGTVMSRGPTTLKHMSDLLWTVSDLHLGHQRVAETRGFSDTGDHDRGVLDGLRAVPDGSVLLCLGDISVRKDAYALGRLAELKAEKNLTMWLIPGNHDRIHPMFGPESVAEWTPLYREIFDVIALDLQVRIGRWQVLMTHLPRASGKDAVPDPHQTPQLARWAGREGFDCTVHGHTHSPVPVRRKHVNLSLEATGMAPVSPERWEELATQAVRFRG